MPELPEVETTRRGVEPLVVGRTITRVIYRTDRLRRPLPDQKLLVGQMLRSVQRRAKYLLFEAEDGWLILHLGMTGHLSVVAADTPHGRHDHVDLVLSDGRCLRFNDMRRFGHCLWTASEPQKHPLLAGLGSEPLAADFSGDELYERSRGRKVKVKSYLMDQRIVVGVGNIYASEALFRAGVHPETVAGAVSRRKYGRIAAAIREVLAAAVEAGGTTLRDFSQPDGRAGYFCFQLQVYGREGEACPVCSAPIRQMRLGGRSTFYCARCQK